MKKTNYPERTHFRVPVGFNQVVEAAATERHCSVPEYLRRLVLAGLASEGLKIPRPAP